MTKLASKRINFLTRVWSVLLGDISQFSMENRMYTMGCIITFILLLITLLINEYIKLYESALIASLVLTMQSVFYYYSRFRKKYLLSSLINIGISYIALVINFYINRAVTGQLFTSFCSHSI